MPINGLTCGYWPDLVRYAHSKGHEMVAHGWEQNESLYMLTREQERENIFKTVEAITRTTGEKPTGWSSPGVRSTDNTLELNVEPDYYTTAIIMTTKCPIRERSATKR